MKMKNIYEYVIEKLESLAIFDEAIGMLKELEAIEREEYSYVSGCITTDTWLEYYNGLDDEGLSEVETVRLILEILGTSEFYPSCVKNDKGDWMDCENCAIGKRAGPCDDGGSIFFKMIGSIIDTAVDNYGIAIEDIAKWRIVVV